MNPDHVDVDQPVLRTLFNELSTASLALEAALSDAGQREACVREAREALEAFRALERSPRPFPVPHRVRLRIQWALSELDDGRLELAGSDIRWAGHCFERALFPNGRRARSH
jgi:hypothetical protein